MIRRALCLAAVLAPLALTACGDRVFSRPKTYGRMIAFPSDGKPVDLNALIRRHPELDGIVMLAPTYNDLLEREMAAKRAEGKPAVPDYRISPGTSFKVGVAGEPQLTETYTVGPFGYIDFPMIGEVTVVNRTVQEVKEEITARLRQYYIDPKVSVNPVALLSFGGLSGRPRAGSIAIFSSGGAGNIDYVGDETIIKVLAGSLGANSEWRQIRVLQRPNAARGRPRGRIIVVDVMAFVFGDFRQDFPLQADDVVIIPEKWSWWEQFDEGWTNMLKFLQGPITIDGYRNFYQNRF